MSVLRKTLLVNGHVLREGYSFVRAELLVEGNRIIGVAERKDEIASLRRAGGDFFVVDLRGGFVIPAFVDAHYHLHGRALKSLRCDLSSAASPTEVMAAIAEWTNSHDAEVVMGVDWDPGRWHDGSWPTRHQLDAAVPDRPVFIRHVSCHSGIVNSMFLSRLRPRFEHSKYDCIDPESGVIMEPATTEATRMTYPDLTGMERCFESAIAEAHALGISAIQDFSQIRDFESYVACLSRTRRQLRIDMFVHASLDQFEALRGTDALEACPQVRLAGIKAYADGTIAEATAALVDPYLDQPTVGYLAISPQDVASLARRAADGAYLCAIHVEGDRALDVVLEGLAMSRSATGSVRLEHCRLMPEPLLRRLCLTEARVTIQPNIIEKWGARGGLYERRLGERRWRDTNSIRRLIEAKIQCALSSDCMPPGPLQGLSSAIDHPIPSERISPAEALTRYTSRRSILECARNEGCVSSGSLADLAVLSSNPLLGSPARIEVLLTMVDGNVVHDMLPLVLSATPK